MQKVKLSSKHQITVPMEFCRKLKLKKGSTLIMEIKDGKIIITPEPDDYVEYFYGIAKGIYGKTAEEIDKYVREERESWE
ncbi:AbrB/MazE/SpoVT family DNA-binding domain-containing protein [Thermoanaerobacterium sp. DL9XJH110]|jgi:AbrB family looped-hinge helix DNA binding protein|uniref:AbrB/MazE/SpoVT family DNA-binding domain-containing protein n=1 Tax=Thermoanaerobacterium sp. DL9XJH110 TaxID=3386643 RepID=UPI003BB5C0D0